VLRRPLPGGGRLRDASWMIWRRGGGGGRGRGRGLEDSRSRRARRWKLRGCKVLMRAEGPIDSQSGSVRPRTRLGRLIRNDRKGVLRKTPSRINESSVRN